jgi:hypothetical protein
MPRRPKREVDYGTIAEIDWGRLAAYLDGEGCIRIHANSPHRKTGYRYHGMMLVVGQREPELCEWLHEKFGGYFYRSKEVLGRTTMHYWRVNTIGTTEILKRCLPYMIVKKAQAEVALEYRETVGSNTKRVSQETRTRQEELKLKLHKLKHGHKGTVEVA